MVIELITAINNSNLKTRKLAEEIFKSISTILSHFNAIPQLFQLLLVGLAGTSPKMKSSKIRALIFNLKMNLTLKIQAENEDQTALKVNKLLAGSETVQEFLRKVLKIIALFLKDATAPKELHRSVLKFIKVVITFLQFSGTHSLQLTELITTHIFAIAKPQKYTMMLRRILNKLIVRVGVAQVMAATTIEH